MADIYAERCKVCSKGTDIVSHCCLSGNNLERTKHMSKSYVRHKLMISSIFFVLIALCPSQIMAQKCGDVISDAEIEKYFNPKGTSHPGIYRVAALVGERAIPELRKLAKAEPVVRGYDYSKQVAAITALARLGDQESIEELDKLLNAEKFIESENQNAIKALAFVGNEKAISILMAYVTKYKSDGSKLFVSHGDYATLPLQNIPNALRSITFKWNVPALKFPQKEGFFLMSAESDYEEWEDWWDAQKDIPLVSIYANVSDPQVRCLAELVDWGETNAILAMSETSSEEVVPLLKSASREPRNRLGTVSGNIDAVLLRLDDATLINEMRDDLGAREPYFRELALSKMSFANTKETVSALVSALGAEDTKIPEGERRKFWGMIINALSGMIEKPPMGSGSEATHENCQRWKQWWAANKDTAVLIRKPVEY